MIIRSQPNPRTDKVSIKSLRKTNEIQDNFHPHYQTVVSRYPPNHIESEQSIEIPIRTTQSVIKPRKKIFDISRSKMSSPMRHTEHYDKNNQSPIQVIQVNAHNERDYFPTMKNLNDSPQPQIVEYRKQKYKVTIIPPHVSHQHQQLEQKQEQINSPTQTHTTFGVKKPEKKSPDLSLYSLQIQETKRMQEAQNTRLSQIQKHLFSQIPQQISLINKTLNLHSSQIKQHKNNFKKFKQKDQGNQRQLLDQLIKKQESMIMKQSELNEQLRKINELKLENSFKSSQIRKYDLELQRAKRVEELAKQNQRLCQELLIKSEKSETRHTNITSPQMNSPHHNSMNAYFRDQNHVEISALQNYKLDEEEEEGNNTIGELLSPFAIDSYYY